MSNEYDSSSTPAVYYTTDAINALVNAGVITADDAATLGSVSSNNWAQHIMNVEAVIRSLGIDYTKVEEVLGFQPGALAGSVINPLVPAAPDAATAPSHSLADALEAAKIARDAATAKANPDTINAIIAEIGVAWAKLVQELNKKF